jgi:hypothetical protein
LDHVNLEERIMDWGGDEGTDWWRRRGGGLGEEERSEDWGGEDGTDRFGGVVGIFFTGSFDPLCILNLRTTNSPAKNSQE